MTRRPNCVPRHPRRGRPRPIGPYAAFGRWRRACGDVDVLSDVLRTIKLTGALFFRLEASSPWADEIPAATVFTPTVLPGAQHVVSYHIVTDGACWATLYDSPPVRLGAGDVLIVPHGDPYIISSAPGVRSETPADAVLSFFRQMATGSAPSVVTEGGGGPGRVRREWMALANVERTIGGQSGTARQLGGRRRRWERTARRCVRGPSATPVHVRPPAS